VLLELVIGLTNDPHRRLDGFRATLGYRKRLAWFVVSEEGSNETEPIILGGGRLSRKAPRTIHPSTRRAFQIRLLDWFGKSRRDLPWRRTADPYSVFVSEIMLQQTQVETVIPYYQRFMERFPTVADLAKAAEEEVMPYWSGLGYYRRARHLHQTARALVERHSGRFPMDRDVLLQLPGIGPYTAGAILSIAHGIPEPVVDGNVERVLARVFAVEEDVEKAGGKKKVWALAKALIPERDPGDFNQALMEIGSLICLPSSPRCSSCPVEPICKGRQRGIEHRLPLKTKNRRREEVQEAVLLVCRGGQWLLTDSNEQSLYPGLWQFPWAWKGNDERDLRVTADRLARKLGLPRSSIEEFHQARHGITYRSIRTTFFFVELPSERRAAHRPGWRWVSRGALQEEALPAYQKRILNRLPE